MITKTRSRLPISCTFLSPTLFVLLNFSSVSKQAKATWKRQPCVNIYDVTSPCEQTFLPIHPSLRAYRESPPPGGGSGPQEAQTGAACPPLIQSICFSFDQGQPSCEGISCVSPLRFHSGLTSKPILAHCFCDVAAGPEMPKQKNVMQVKLQQLCPQKKWNSYSQNIKPWLPLNPSFCACCPHTSLFHSRAEWK